MTIEFTAFNPENDIIGIMSSKYLTMKFAAFDNVAGTLSTDAEVSEYAFVGPDGGSIIFHAADGWTVDPATGEILGTLDTISFGQQTITDSNGTFTQQALELQISGLSISADADLENLFDMASHGNFGAFGSGSTDSLYSIIDTEGRTVIGSSGIDLLNGSSHSDLIRGGGGDDRISGGDGTEGDRISGGAGNDSILGSDGNDVLYGDSGDDIIRGKFGNDIIKGGDGNDNLRGDRGDDRIWGGDGDDIVSGGHGNDTLYGGAGNDLLYGGLGIDTFVFEKDAGDDRLYGFSPGKAGKDLIVFRDVGLHSFADVLDHAVDVEDGILITYDEGSLRLQGLHLSQLDSHDFSFA